MKRLVSLLLCMLMFTTVFFAFSGCTKSVDTTESEKDTETEKVEIIDKSEKTETTVSDTTETRPVSKYPYTIIDQAGREVVIEKEFNRVVFSSVRPVPSVYFTAMGNIDKLVGMNPASLSAAKYSMFAILAPEIVNVPTNFVIGNETNIEELAGLEPDVVFCLNTNEAEIAAIESLGITAVGMNTNGTNAIELFSDWVDLIGSVMDKETRADTIIERSLGVQTKVREVAATIPQDEKKSALFIYDFNAGKLRVSGSNLYSQYWIETVGAINVAAELNHLVEVNLEQIYAWDPDYIFITNFTTLQAEDLINNTIEGQDWSGLSAVQNGNVYKNPLGIYRWFTPTADAALMLEWVAQKIYPDYFDYYTIEQEIRDHYRNFYNYRLSEDELNLILHPASDAAVYVRSAN